MRVFCVVSALAAISLLGAAGAHGSSSPRAVSATSVFTDPGGDAGTAADVAVVSVQNDASGQITFHVALSAAPSSTDRLELFLDSDRNPSTGDPYDGSDWVILIDFGSTSFELGTWNGSGYVDAASASTVHVSSEGTNVSLSVNASELGNTTGFDFWIDSIDGSPGSGHEDEAPDTGLWRYTLESTTPAAPAAPTAQFSVVAATAPKTARAGHTYAAALGLRSDTDAFAGGGPVLTCSAREGGKTLHAVPKAVGTANLLLVSCVVKVPKSARGKVLHLTITARMGDTSATKTFSAVIR
jgi:hypothetical protein